MMESAGSPRFGFDPTELYQYDIVSADGKASPRRLSNMTDRKAKPLKRPVAHMALMAAHAGESSIPAAGSRTDRSSSTSRASPKKQGAHASAPAPAPAPAKSQTKRSGSVRGGRGGGSGNVKVSGGGGGGGSMEAALQAVYASRCAAPALPDSMHITKVPISQYGVNEEPDVRTSEEAIAFFARHGDLSPIKFLYLNR
jgi:hypothetical protein